MVCDRKSLTWTGKTDSVVSLNDLTHVTKNKKYKEETKTKRNA